MENDKKTLEEKLQRVIETIDVANALTDPLTNSIENLLKLSAETESLKLMLLQLFQILPPPAPDYVLATKLFPSTAKAWRAEILSTSERKFAAIKEPSPD